MIRNKLLFNCCSQCRRMLRLGRCSRMLLALTSLARHAMPGHMFGGLLTSRPKHITPPASEMSRRTLLSDGYGKPGALQRSRCLDGSDRLNTRNMLKRRHYNIGTNFDCLLCGQHEETVEHLFFHCTFSERCWQKLNIKWSRSDNRLQLLYHAKTSRCTRMFMDIFLVAAWSLERTQQSPLQSPTIEAWREVQDRFC